MMNNQSKKKEIQELYRDAINHHLLCEGFSDYKAEVEARRRKAHYDELYKYL